MSEEGVITEDAVPTDESVEGESAESKTLAESLSEATGKRFDNDEAALKSIKDTFSYVGKVGKYQPAIEKLEQQLGGEEKVLQHLSTIQRSGSTTEKEAASDVMAELNAMKHQLAESNFYSENSEYKEYKDLINSMLPAFENSHEKVVSSDAFKKTYEGLKAGAEAQSAKSVLHSNPRLGQAQNKMEKAREAADKGNYSQAAASAVSAVIDAYDK